MVTKSTGREVKEGRGRGGYVRDGREKGDCGVEKVERSLGLRSNEILINKGKGLK